MSDSRPPAIVTWAPKHRKRKTGKRPRLSLRDCEFDGRWVLVLGHPEPVWMPYPDDAQEGEA